MPVGSWTLLLSRLLSHGLEKAAEDGPVVGPLSLKWETRMEFLVSAWPGLAIVCIWQIEPTDLSLFSTASFESINLSVLKEESFFLLT